MKMRKPLDKEEARARRDRLVEKAERAQLSLTEGVREMRAISGLTQDQFAEHRGLGTRVVKALESGKSNPTVATLNRIANFYGLEVGFVPSKQIRSLGDEGEASVLPDPFSEIKKLLADAQRNMDALLEDPDMVKRLIDQPGKK